MSELVLRVLQPHDIEMLYAHYEGLDEDSKGWRFGVQISDYALRCFVQSLDLTQDIHFAITTPTTIVALAQVSKYSPSHAHCLELGISVAACVRRHGFASLLWECATAHAQECNMQEMHVLYSPHNKAMAAFCRSKNLRIEDRLGEHAAIWTNPSWVHPSRDKRSKAPQASWPGELPWPSIVAIPEPTPSMA